MKCQTCGSTKSDSIEPQEYYVKPCPHCGVDKCSLCDMGDDCSCINCEGGEYE